MESPTIGSSASPIAVLRLNTQTRLPLSLLPLPDTQQDSPEASQGLQTNTMNPSVDRGHVVDEDYIFVASMDNTIQLEQQVSELIEENMRMAERIRSFEDIVAEVKLKVREAFQALDCSICRTTINKPVITGECRHCFCDSCLTQWLQGQLERKTPKTCPLCRTWLFEDPQMIPVQLLRDMVETLQGIRVLAPEGSGIDLTSVLNPH